MQDLQEASSAILLSVCRADVCKLRNKCLVLSKKKISFSEKINFGEKGCKSGRVVPW